MDTDAIDPSSVVVMEERPSIGGEMVDEDQHRPPRFTYKLAESIRRYVVLAEAGLRQQVWQYNSKPGGYALAQRSGVSTPRTYRASVDIAELTLDHVETFGDRFVIKSHDGAASRGVLLLVRRGDDVFFELRERTERSWADLVAEFETRAASGHASQMVNVEEFLRPPAPRCEVLEIPDDWKVYCFYDRPVLVVQSRLPESGEISKRIHRYWSPDWIDLGAVYMPDRRGPGMDLPVNGPALIDAAVAIAKNARSAFLRIDLFETDRGVVFGEVTPHPGGTSELRDDVDQAMGRAWELAEARLMAEDAVGVVPVVPVDGRTQSA